MNRGLFSRNRKTQDVPGKKACGVPNLAENDCGVKPHSSETGDKAVHLGVLSNLRVKGVVGVALYEGRLA